MWSPSMQVLYIHIQKFKNIGNFEYWKFWIFCHEESIKAWGNRHFYPDLDNVHTFPNITWYPMNISNFSFIYQWLIKKNKGEKEMSCGRKGPHMWSLLSGSRGVPEWVKCWVNVDYWHVHGHDQDPMPWNHRNDKAFSRWVSEGWHTLL